MDNFPAIQADGNGIGTSPPHSGSGSRPVAAEPPKTRACANCARLKMKCRWPESEAGQVQDTSCIRCTRMSIPCHVPAPVQRKKRGKSTRVAQLEKKIDGLVSMIASSQHIQASGTPPLTPESHGTGAVNDVPKLPLQKSLEDVVPQIHSSQNAHLPPQMPLAIPTDLSTTFQLIPGFSFSLEEARSYFDIYRREFMPNYPFFILPEDLDPRTLYATSRCLFWTILAAVTPQSSATQQGVENWFRQYIADRMVVKQEKNLSLLQAILLHLAWADFHFYMRTEATNFVHLATALAMDLKLDRSPETTRMNPRSLLGDAWATVNKTASRPMAHSVDEKRAVLGLYHITSLLSCLFKRGNSFSWNKYLSQCCDSLTGTGSILESDLFLVALVKMQRVADRAYSMVPGFDASDAGSSAYLSPMDMVINNARRELYDFFSMQPDCVKGRNIFKAYYHVTLMRLAEPAIPVQCCVSVDMGLHPEPLQRFDTIWKCLLAAVDFFDALFAFHPNELPSLPASVTGLLAFAIVTCSRLLLLDPSIDWQPVMARRKLDFADVLKRLSDRFEDADAWAKEAGRRRRLLEGGDAQFCRLSFKLRWIRQWYLSRMPQDQPSMAETQPPSDLLQDSDTAFWQEYEFEDTLWPDFMTMYNPGFVTAPLAET